jgi:hypothetical protein
MNKRIKQLAVRAGATLEKGYIELSDGQFMLSDNNLDKTNLDLEKFAELIVRECMSVARGMRNPSNLNYKPSDHFVNELRLHFGVEE